MESSAFRLAVADFAAIGPKVLAAPVDHQDGMLLGGSGLNTSDKRHKEDCSGKRRNFHTSIAKLCPVHRQGSCILLIKFQKPDSSAVTAISTSPLLASGESSCAHVDSRTESMRR